MLKGQAKTDYQREYMRRRRIGQSAPPSKPKPAWERKVWSIGSSTGYVEGAPAVVSPGLGAEVIDGLKFDTDEEWLEACYRFKGITEARQQEREAEEEQSADRADPSTFLQPPPILPPPPCFLPPPA